MTDDGEEVVEDDVDDELSAAGLALDEEDDADEDDSDAEDEEEVSENDEHNEGGEQQKDAADQDNQADGDAGDRQPADTVDGKTEALQPSDDGRMTVETPAAQPASYEPPAPSYEPPSASYDSPASSPDFSSGSSGLD